MGSDNRFLGIPVWKWDGVAGACAALGILVIMITAVIGVYQLNARAEAARAQATLDMLDVWEERGFLEKFQSLDGEVKSVLAEIPAEDINAARESKAIETRLYERVSTEVLRSPGAVQKFETIIYFFQRVHICITAELCAEDATLQFFGGPMEDFAKVFAAEIKRRRGGDPNYAGGLLISD